MSFFKQVSMLFFMLGTFFQTPSWCIFNPIADENCTGTVGNTDLIPVSGIPYVNPLAYNLLEIVLVSFLTYVSALKQKFRKQSKKTKIRLIIMIILTSILIIFDLLQLILHYASLINMRFPLNSFLKVAYFSLY